MTSLVSTAFIIVPRGIVVLRGDPAALASIAQVLGDDIARAITARYAPEYAMSAIELTDIGKSAVEAAQDSSPTLGTIRFIGSTAFGTAVGLASSVILTPLGGAALGFFAGKVYEAIFDAIRDKVTTVDCSTDLPYSLAIDCWPGVECDASIAADVESRYTSARNWTPPSDPLVLDLNGGGISTSGINPAAPLYFDHAGDGLPNATGWVGAGEGLVVRDLNGNGLIDTGRELFGDNTVLTTGPNVGKNATDGFAALRDLDSNADGKFDASDAAFSSVKIWKDQNQDGISQSTELFSLAEQGVQAINLGATASNINLGGGNTQTFAGSFDRVGGGAGAAATADLVGNLLLSSNNFYRQFNDDPALTPTCGRARRASVPTGLRARGRGACCAPLNGRQHLDLHASSAATANWLRPTGTATRHAGGAGCRTSGSSQVRKVQPVRNAVIPSAAAPPTRNHHQLRSHAATCRVG